MTRQVYRSRQHVFAVLLTLSMLFAVVSRASGQTANLSSTSHNFRSVAVGATSATYNVNLRNTSSTTALTITSIVPSGPFAETTTCGSSLGTRSSCTISITFVPIAVGATTGSVVITDNATSGTTQTITLSGTGTGELTVSPTSGRFGTTGEGATSTADTFTLTNNSATAVPVTIASSSPEFIESDNCDGDVAASSTCTISVTFDPTATGTQTGSITVTYSGAGSPLTISLTGNGSIPLTLTPTRYNFGPVGIDATSTAESFTLTNRSTAAQAVTISTAAPFAESNTCGTSVAASSTCTISTTFDPTAAGVATGSLTVSYGTGSTLTSTLSGNGVTPVIVNPSSITFSSNVSVGEPSTARTVTLTNNTSSAVTLDSVVASPAAYAITSNTCGTSVAADSSCTLSIVFTPAVTGTTTGTLTITYGSSNVQIVVSMTGGAQVNRLTSLAITEPSATLAVGATEQLTATGTYANGTTGNVTDAATWSSSNTAVATVSSTGVVTGVAAGPVVITAAVAGTNDGTVSNTASLTVNQAATLTAITLTSSQGSTTADTSPTVAAGATLQLYATGTYSNGTSQDITASATWASTNTASATVSAAGLITGISGGTATISATLSGVTGSATLTVNTLTAITLTAAQGSTTAIAPPTLVTGTTLQVYATGTYSNNSTQDITAAATWLSATTADATVSGGLITAVAAGSSLITASVGSINASTTATITAPTLVSISITPATATVAAGDSQQFTATGSYSNNTTQNITANVTWSSSNSGVIMSSATAGLATAGDSAIGASVSISASMVTSTGTTVTAATPAVLTVGPAALVSIAVTPASASIAEGTTEQFTATGTYSDGSTQNLTSTVTWSATGGAATFSGTTAAGLAQASDSVEGTVTITATSGTISGSTTLTVTAPVLTSIVVTNVAPANPPTGPGSPADVTIYQGQTEQFYAVGAYSNGTYQNITLTAAWSTSAGTVATISTAGATAGLATAVGGGAVTISATSGTIVGDATLNVTGLSSIAVTPSDPTAALGDANTGDPYGATNNTLQFTATATFTDTTTQNVTASATWTSGTTSVATIGGTTGLATILEAGTSTITATYAGVSGNTTLTVSAAILESLAVCLGAYPSTNCSTSTASVGVTLGLDGTQQFSAVGSYSNGTTQNLTSLVTWTAGTPAAVTVSTTGLATVIAANNAANSITASYGTIAGGLNADTAWVTASSTLPIVCTSPTINMNILVVNNAAESYADFPAIEQILNYVGTPYTVVDAVSGPVPMLSSGCTANYQGVIFANGGDYFTISWQAALISFEETFNIRQVNWYSYPYPNFGLTPTGTDISSTATYTTNFTSGAASIFFYANQASPLTIANAYVYLAAADAGSGSLTPLLEDSSGNIVSATYSLSGQQFLTQTFDSNPSLTHDLVVAYGLLNWVTQGVFLGDYHVYATQEVDDNFINDTEWLPSTPCLSNPAAEDRTAPDASILPVFRANYSNDMAQLVTWQNTKQANTLLAPGSNYETSINGENSGKFELTLAMNGVGTTGNGDWTGLVAPIVSSSATGGVATFIAQDFSGQAGDTVVISNTTNGNGVLNGTYTILTATPTVGTAATATAPLIPGTSVFTVSNTLAGTLAQATEAGVADNSTTPTVSEADSLVGNLSLFQSNFHWISHTYDHPATLNGLCQSTPVPNPLCTNTTDTGDDIELEVLTNLFVASNSAGLNLDTQNSPCTGGGTTGYCDTVVGLTFTDFNPGNIVTPGVTGLNDPLVPGYLYGYGIRYAVSDTSVATTTNPPNNNGPNPSPNVGIVNSYEPLLYEVPRHPNDVFYNVANWADDQAEFDCVYTYYVPPGSTAAPAPDPPFNTYNAAQILDFVSTSFVNNMLMGDMDPEMFHQPDLHFSQNYANLTNTAPSGTMPASVTAFLAGQTSHVSSLLSDTYDLTFSKYAALYKLPVLTPTLDQLGVLMQNRNSFNLSGVTASLVGGFTSSATITLTMPSTATVNAVIPVTGAGLSTTSGYELYGGQNISHITMTPGTTVSIPVN
ncbi:MAG TPA: choice-of-anchor D domain-containing protein [Terriglobales bacterium]|nr:choice-of-anchor D domain-containing protein [Terriglobales bacterium]